MNKQKAFGAFEFTMIAMIVACIVAIMYAMFWKPKPVSSYTTTVKKEIVITNIEDPKHFRLAYMDLKTGEVTSDYSKYCSNWNDDIKTEVGESFIIDYSYDTVTLDDGSVEIRNRTDGCDVILQINNQKVANGYEIKTAA